MNTIPEGISEDSKLDRVIGCSSGKVYKVLYDVTDKKPIVKCCSKCFLVEEEECTRYKALVDRTITPFNVQTTQYVCVLEGKYTFKQED